MKLDKFTSFLKVAGKFIETNRWWLIILLVFTLVRITFFATFWQVSLSRGGWQNFYQQAYAFGQQGLGPMNLFHEYCDWHPPLYYALNSAILVIFQIKWPIYVAQFFLALVGLFFCYKLARLFLRQGAALIVTFILALEPLWAWQFLLYTSENLSLPLFIAGMYFFYKYYRTVAWQELILSALLLGLATLTRPNYLLLVFVFPLFLLFSYFFRQFFELVELSRLNWRQITSAAAVYFLIFVAVLSPWIIRNRLVYQRYTLANILSTNVYFYNLPALISWQKKIPYAAASQQVIAWAQRDLGDNVGDQGDCQKFSLVTFNYDLDYYSRHAKNYILANLPAYSYIHLVRSLPYFFQPGYFEIWSAYTGVYNKPDFSTLVQNGDWHSFLRLFGKIDAQLFVHLLGIAFWGLCSLCLLLSLIISYKRDRKNFIYFLLATVIILYNAAVVSPFVTARYRLPVYVLFVISLVYVIVWLLNRDWSLRHCRQIIKRLPLLAVPAKLVQERWRERKLHQEVEQLAVAKQLPFETELPPQLALGHEPTIRCNLLCKMCYQRENRGHRQEEMPTADVLGLYDGLAGRINEVKLVGGEPLVHPGIFQLLDYWNQRDVPLILQTNCTLINENNIVELAKYNKLRAILTSLDGPEAMHDSIRGVPGSFKRLRTAIELIKKHLPQTEISAFATLLLDDNLDCLYELIRTAKQLGLTGLNILFEQFYSPAEAVATKKILADEFGWEEGRDYRLNTQLRETPFKKPINPRQLKRKLFLVRIYGAFVGVPVNFVPFNYYDRLPVYLGLEKARPFCHKLLTEELRVSQEGELIWCDIIEKSFGNLKEKTLEEIWLSHDFQKFRHFLQRRSLPICYRCCKASYLKK